MSSLPLEEQIKYLQAQKPVLEKLGKIQSELFVPKGQSNDFGHYSYRSCEDILTAVKPLCAKNNCVLRIGDSKVDLIGDRYYISVAVQLYDLDSCGSITVEGRAREEDQKKGMDGSQVTGAAISYARKYALAGLFCIDNEKDSDATNRGDQEPAKGTTKKEEPGKISKQEINAIKAELTRTGVNESVVCDAVGKKKLTDFTQADYITIIKRLNATSDKE